MPTAAIEHKKLLINNEWRDASAGKTMDVVNPATEEVIATVASASQGAKKFDHACLAQPGELRLRWTSPGLSPIQ